MEKPRPLDRTETPAGLDGSQGANRASAEDNRLGATTDRQAVSAWLDEYEEEGLDGQPHPTWTNYRKEAERLLLWAWLVREKALSSLDRSDMQAYARFLAHPRKSWVGPRHHRSHPNWRPFTGPVSRSGRAQASRILNSLFRYLVEKSYLRVNPLAGTPKLRRRKTEENTRQGAERHLSRAAFDFAIDCEREAIEANASECEHPEAALKAVSPAAKEEEKKAARKRLDTALRERDRLARERWVIAWLLASGARRAETARARMGEVRQEEPGKTWWWHVLGKGGKKAKVPLPPEALPALKAYRRSLALSPLPAPSDKTPLVCRLPRSGQDIKRHLTPAVIYDIVDQFFTRASKRSQESSRSNIKSLSEVLGEASTHWMRHTAITRQVDAGVPLTHIRRNARHSALGTTDKYIHEEDEARARSIQRLGQHKA